MKIIKYAKDDIFLDSDLFRLIQIIGIFNYEEKIKVIHKNLVI